MLELSATQIRDKIAAGELSAQEVTRFFLGRIETHDEKLGGFLSVLSERAIARAKEVDEGKVKGKLAGVPVALKDNIHVAGEISTCGSKFLENFRAPFDATATRLLEAEGAIIIGKTNMDEFAMGSTTGHSAYKPGRNPWDLDRVPGGSSGGSAIAVAARLSPLSLGSETGGSVRQPASLCGVVGFKPTYGRVSRYGLVAFGSSLDQISPFANRVEDIGLIMETLGQHDAHDSTSLPIETQSYTFNGSVEGLKIGVPVGFLEGLEAEVRANLDASIEVMSGLGAQIVEVELDMLKYALAVYYILATAEASTNLARFDGVRYGLRSERAKTLREVYDFSKEEGFGHEVKRRILLGTYVLSAGYQDAYYRKAQRVRTLIKQAYKTAFSQCDLIAMPVSPFPAFEIGSVRDPMQEYLADIYTVSANLSGIPAISVPSGFTKEGLPLGFQLQGPQQADPLVCRAADAFEKATGYTHKIAEAVQ